ncbi:MAG TPA: transglycosylase SLT domain-containing protein [Candidatus Binatia bacterium]|nr:transglycosylase SLT domain-containing protein [Candidatus Binatia bacterium]
MVPTLHDVVGAPVPGTSGVRPTPRPQVPFRQILRQLQAPQQRVVPHGVSRPSGASRPAPVYRMPVPHATLPEHTQHGAAVGTAGRTGASAPAVAAAVRRAALTAGVRPALSVAVARAESSLNPAARSPDGKSSGTFQVTRTTAAEMRRKFAAGIVARPAGSDDVALGVGYLRYLDDLFSRGAQLGRGVAALPVADGAERQLFAVAAFNAGEGRVALAQARAAASGKDPTHFADVRAYLPSITQGYVARVSTYAQEESRRAGEPPTSPLVAV